MKDQLEVAAKIFAGSAAILYLAGFAVVSLHLAGFGYSGMDFLQPQYFAAGFWSLLPLVLGWALFSPVLEKVEPLFQAPLRRFLAALLGFGVVFAAATLVLFYGSDWIYSLNVAGRWMVIAAAGSVASFALVAFVAALRSQIRRKARPSAEIAGVAIFAGVFFSLLAVLYLANVARSLYGEIPGSLGGGKPRSVKLLVDAEEKEHLAPVARLLSDDGEWTRPVLLLTATDDELVLLSADRSTLVTLQKDLVQAVIYPRQ